MSDLEQRQTEQNVCSMNEAENTACECEKDCECAMHEGSDCQDEAVSENDLVLECETLRGQIKILEASAQKDKETMLRAIAEAENARKRAEADVERERKFAMEKFVKGIIPVIDALDKALELSDRNDPATKATIDGVEATLNLLIKELSAFGVEIINPVGDAFDPNFHQAISMVPSAEVPANHIVAVMQKGVVLHGRVVRAATVIVARA
ncbi:Heat shock protein B25.3 [Anaerobiospirillum thomasii]|uniref:Protein GrpE n=1 Tax=Anaerobiospirillum thomasii TaxID=179995 RepID=A0A2X0WLR1_9GAMM|nr:nucleotide exchange factor GrpE [Anaerobiospirillum thomasii]SPT69986.1 Heat shock protein B25.3 [Anaerobiospirillum thomasii]SPT71367.1 Heat shock protein B25.3 [Anaerobiospirillum thomasii]